MDSGKKKKSVCIVGAGMTGLCTCKYMLRHGLQPLVLEAGADVGGVWRNTYDTTVLQNSYSTYQFSDFPWPPATPRHPSHHGVLAYFQAYAKHFNLIPNIRFNTKVIALHEGQQQGWIVTISNNDIPHLCKTTTMEFDFVVLCTGRFGDVPHLPTFNIPTKGPGIFGGKVLHAMEYSKLSKEEARELLQGKKVAVVGFHKSALDIAMEATEMNYSPHAGSGYKKEATTLMIYRRPYWLIPNNSTWEARLALLYFTRFSEFIHRKPPSHRRSLLWEIFLQPLRWVISTFIQISILDNLPLQKNGLVPKETFVDQMTSCVIAKPPPSFFERVEEGYIRLCKSPKWSFYGKGLVLNDNDDALRELVEVDVVILATGYDSQAKILSLIPENYRNQLFDSNGVLPLYRGIIPCTIRDLAILGYQLNFANIHSSEMGARWLSYMLAGRIELPEPKTMKKEAQIMAEYVRESAFPSHSCLGLVQIWYTDQLCKDMGWNPKRKRNFFQELFSPYTILDYQEQ